MQGIIIGNISNLYKVKAGKEIYEVVARGKFKKEDELKPVVGDRVEINEKDAVIEKVLKRDTYIKRPKIANITQIVFVVSTKHPKPDLLMLDKQICYVESLGIKPIIVINKIDLEESYKQIKDIYKKIGYKVLLTNAKSKVGIRKLKKELKGKISAFSGNSGVGKSTIINALFNDKLTLEGEISSKNKKGKNTTTDVKLYELGKNTYIADTPGFSSFEITEIESKDLDKYFIDFKKYIKKCEFVGCTHIKEENCAIKKAVEEAKISQERYDRFKTIYNELKDKEAHKW